jgi:hypothetical protein
MGGAEVIGGGLTMVNLAMFKCAFSPPDKFADSNASIPLPPMLLMRGCKGLVGRECGRSYLSATGGAHRDCGVVASQQCAMVER